MNDRDDTCEIEDGYTKYYKILDNHLLCSKPITKKNIINIITRNESAVKKEDSKPKIIENMERAHSDDSRYIEEYLLGEKDVLLTNIININQEKARNAKKYEFHSCYSTTFDSLEGKYGKWKSSEYDPCMDNKKIFQNSQDHDDYLNHNDNYAYSVMFSNDKEKKIVPLMFPIGDLMLNLIYVNPHLNTYPREFINNDFDINICKQLFDGKKITLHSMGDLIHKRFRYNIDCIINNNFRDNANKYICFRKRIEKYKVKGFTCVNEDELINKVKNILEIKHMQSNIELIKKKFEGCGVLEKYFYEVTQQSSQIPRKYLNIAM